MLTEMASEDRRQPKFYCPHCSQVFGLLPELGAGDLAIIAVICPGCGQQFFAVKRPEQKSRTGWVILPFDPAEAKSDLLPGWLLGVLGQIMENSPDQAKRPLPDNLEDWVAEQLDLSGDEGG